MSLSDSVWREPPRAPKLLAASPNRQQTARRSHHRQRSGASTNPSELRTRLRPQTRQNRRANHDQGTLHATADGTETAGPGPGRDGHAPARRQVRRRAGVPLGGTEGHQSGGAVRCVDSRRVRRVGRRRARPLHRGRGVLPRLRRYGCWLRRERAGVVPDPGGGHG